MLCCVYTYVRTYVHTACSTVRKGRRSKGMQTRMRGGTAAVFPAAEAPSCKRTTASSLARPVPLSADQVSPEAKQVPSDQKVSDPQGQSAPTLWCDVMLQMDVANYCLRLLRRSSLSAHVPAANWACAVPLIVLLIIYLFLYVLTWA